VPPIEIGRWIRPVPRLLVHRHRVIRQPKIKQVPLAHAGQGSGSARLLYRSSQRRGTRKQLPEAPRLFCRAEVANGLRAAVAARWRPGFAPLADTTCRPESVNNTITKPLIAARMASGYREAGFAIHQPVTRRLSVRIRSAETRRRDRRLAWGRAAPSETVSRATVRLTGGACIKHQRTWSGLPVVRTCGLQFKGLSSDGWSRPFGHNGRSVKSGAAAPPGGAPPLFGGKKKKNPPAATRR